MALTEVQKVRLEVGDTDPALPILADAEYEYFLEKNNNSVQRSALDAAKSLLFKLSMKTRRDVDILSIHGQQAAQNYIAALKLYISNPSINVGLLLAEGYAGGISKADMQANDANPDNNVPTHPYQTTNAYAVGYFSI